MTRSVAVFGSSEPMPGAPLYETARRVGTLLAEHGLEVVNGGYGGVMEGASRGAREAGGRVVGITTLAFQQRAGGNRFLSEEISEPDLLMRTRTLLDRPQGFVVLPGGAGTLAEVALLWALHRAGLLGRRPVVLLGGAWPGLVSDLERHGMLESAAREMMRFADSPETTVQLVALGLDDFDRFRQGGSQG